MTRSELATKLLAFYDNKPERWTKGRMARDSSGAGTTAMNKTACSWCMLGASYQEGIWSECLALFPRVVELNDKCKTFAEVRTLLEEMANER